ncbi:MAG TPA: hypothetical protein VN622_16705 [Clostridia bacterium]|nr:hypothetical protein [Clostridia bacterium]
MEDLVARHLESIGSAKQRSDAKSRTAEGRAKVDSILAASTHLEGQAAMFSSGRKSKTVIRFGARDYPGEQFVFDGSTIKVALTGVNTRSSLGDFVNREQALLKEGLLGGSLFTSWALLDLPGRKAQLRYEGLKKVDGRELHRLDYIPKKSGDASIHLYFEQDTFRHVKTEYLLRVDAPMGRASIAGRESLASRQTVHTEATKFRLEEWFDDFRQIDALTLPVHWRLRMTIEPAATAMLEWDIKLAQIATNPPVDEKSIF